MYCILHCTFIVRSIIDIVKLPPDGHINLTFLFARGIRVAPRSELRDVFLFQGSPTKKPPEHRLCGGPPAVGMYAADEWNRCVSVKTKR
jgi:hypothetical protein